MRSKNLITLNDPTSHVSEAYKMFRTNLSYMNVDKSNQVIMFTSATSAEGKTTTVCNTAISFAQNGFSTLLIEADLRRARVHELMGLPQKPGLTNIVAEKAYLSDVAWEVEEVPNLSVITAGPFPPSPAELLGSKAIEDIIQSARGVYDKIIIDAPPLLHVTDAGILSRFVDGVIIVVAANETKTQSLKQAMKALDKVNANILGAVLTKVKIGFGTYYYNAYKSYYTKDDKRRWWHGKGRDKNKAMKTTN